MSHRFSGKLTVQVHPSVLDRGWVGYACHYEPGRWEFHSTVDTRDEPLESVSLQSLLDLDYSLTQLECLPPMSQAWRWERGAEFQSSHLAIGPTYFFQLEISPLEDHPNFDELGPSIADCWIRISTESEAVQLIHQLVAKHRWKLDAIQGPEIHIEDDYIDDPTGVEYYNQAQTDGDVIVFYTVEDEA